MLINTHTYYSLNYGVLSVHELLSLVKEYGYNAIALTDINSTSASLDFLRRANEYGVKPSIGVDFRNGIKQCYIGLAQSNKGYQYLNIFLSEHLHNKTDFPDRAPELPDVVWIYPYSTYTGFIMAPNEWLGIRPSELNNLRFSKWINVRHKMLALPTCTFVKRFHHNAHKLLRAIGDNVLISKLNEKDYASMSDVFPKKEALIDRYKDYTDLLANTQHVLSNNEVNFRFKEPGYNANKLNFNLSANQDLTQLKQLCEEGLRYRFGENTDSAIRERLNKEVSLIHKKGFVGYFLMNWDIVNYARHKNYYYVGRGSGANSLVAFLLKITDVDPIELDLYFERFMNLYRQNPPDFDIDFSWKDRDDVTRYIFGKYPTASLLGTYITYKSRSVIRELGKVFGLPKHEIDKLGSSTSKYSSLDHNAKSVVHYSRLIQGFPSGLSVHASGIIIPEEDTTFYGATFMPPKGYRTSQFSMIEAEDVGLCKFDILSQRGLGKIKDCLEIIGENQPENPPEDIRNVSKFKSDPDVNQLLKEGNAIGCFYVESPAMRMLLSKLKVGDYLGLVAASSIIRPGVAKSGMMREYILRHHGLPGEKPMPSKMAELMPDTYGVMVYQEDVIKVAHLFAGLSLGEADELRRGMSGKYRSREEFNKVKQTFINNCKERNYSSELIDEVWNQIESFAGYAFSKGHSASYAVESYQCLYLKAYYPIEYMVATLNNYGGFYRNDIYINEAKKHGAVIHSPCVNNSKGLTVLKGKDVYLGFMFINGLEGLTARMIVDSRGNPYDSFEDFIDRVPISIEQISLLIRSDAFRFIGLHKRQLLWKAHHMLGKQVSVKSTQKLFDGGLKVMDVPTLEKHPYEDIYDQMELFGFTLSSPFSLLENVDYDRIMARDLPRFKGLVISIKGYLVTIKNTSTSNGKRMNFGTFLDEEGAFFDTTHFPPSLKQSPFRGRGVYTIDGLVVEEFGFYSLEVQKMTKENYVKDE